MHPAPLTEDLCVNALYELMSQSVTLQYFRGYCIEHVRKDVQDYYYIHNANPTAALLLPCFFRNEVGLFVERNSVERMKSNTRHSFGVYIPRYAISSNMEAISQIIDNFSHHACIMRLLNALPGMDVITLTENCFSCYTSPQLAKLLKQHDIITTPNTPADETMATFKKAGSMTIQNLHNKADSIRNLYEMLKTHSADKKRPANDWLHSSEKQLMA